MNTIRITTGDPTGRPLPSSLSIVISCRLEVSPREVIGKYLYTDESAIEGQRKVGAGSNPLGLSPAGQRGEIVLTRLIYLYIARL